MIKKPTKSKKPKKNSNLADYIYIRVGEDVKERLILKAEKEGTNMTICARQILISGLD
jgi:hypothetical protein